VTSGSCLKGIETGRIRPVVQRSRRGVREYAGSVAQSADDGKAKGGQVLEFRQTHGVSVIWSDLGVRRTGSVWEARSRVSLLLTICDESKSVPSIPSHSLTWLTDRASKAA
jgi:hypothetical protein